MKLVWALLGAMLLTALGSWLVARSGRLGSCTDLPVEEAPSPDGSLVAARFEHSCSGSRALTTQVSLRAAGTPFAPDEPSVVFATAGQAPVRVGWRDARTLLIESPASGVLVEKPSWRGVAVLVRRVY